MIIYSIVPYDVIFSQEQENYEGRKYVNYKGELLEVSTAGGNSYKIDRIISTNPKAYLDIEIQPGTHIKLL